MIPNNNYLHKNCIHHAYNRSNGCLVTVIHCKELILIDLIHMNLDYCLVNCNLTTLITTQ